MDTTIFLVLIVVLIPLTGVISAITPWLMRENECFAVTVPATAQKDPVIRGYKVRYTASLLILSLVCTVLIGVLIANASEQIAMIVLTVSIFVVVIGSFLLMLHYRRAVLRLKDERGWHAQTSIHAALVGEGDTPRPLPLAWEFLNVPVIVFTAAVSWMLYPSMPDQVPMHMDLSGNITSWVDKSPATMAFPLLVQVVIFVTMLFSHYMIIHSKKAVDPAAPASSAYAYGLFAHAQSAFLVVFGILIDAVMVCLPLSFANVLTMSQSAVVVMVASLACVGAALVLSIRYGQAGSRVAGHVEGDDSLVDDDDAHWKLGVFYFNPTDASVFLHKRFGIGWTLNFARLQAWLMIGGLVLVMVILVVASSMMFD